MNKLQELQRRKAELKVQIEQQRDELKKTMVEVREEMEPANLLKKAMGGIFGFSKKKTGEEPSSILTRLPAPLAFLVDVAVRDPKWAIGLKLLAPLAIKYWPKFQRSKEKAATENGTEAPAKPNLYGKLRQGISSLRGQLRKTKKTSNPTEEGNTNQINSEN